MAWQISFNLNWNKGLRSIKYILSLLIKRVTVRKLLDRNSSMTLLFYYLAPMQIDTNVTSWCMQLIFWDKRAATCLIRECPTCDWKKRWREREKGASAYEMDIYCLMSFFYRINHLFCIVFSSIWGNLLILTKRNDKIIETFWYFYHFRFERILSQEFEREVTSVSFCRGAKW